MHDAASTMAKDSPAHAGPILVQRKDDAMEQVVDVIHPIHGAVVRLTWYAAVAWCHLSVPWYCSWCYSTLKYHGTVPGVPGVP